MEGEGRRLYEFGRFRLDAAEGVLLHDNVPVPLAPKILDVLSALVERAGHLVSKDELMAAAWADAFVEDANLTQSIFVLRKTLGDGNGGGKVIETVPRRGYRFVAPVRVVTSGDKVVSNSERAVEPAPVALPVTTPLSQRWKNFFAPIGLFAVFLIVVGLATNNFYRSESQNPPVRDTVAQTSRIDIRRLTSDSRAYSPAISADGRLLAYRRVEDNMESIWLKDIAADSDIRIRPPSAEGYTSLVFSPDASELYYRVEKKLPDGSSRGIVMRSPVFGGVEKKVTEQPWSNFALSKDGGHIAFIRSTGKPEGNRVLVTADTTTGDERILAKSEPGKYIFSLWGTAPSWSPDGKRIVVCGQKGSAYEDAALFEVSLDDGAVRELAAPRWQRTFQTAWLNDGSGLIVVASERRQAPLQIWRLSYPSGEAVRLTNDLHDYGTIAFARDSNTLIAQQEIRNTHIWVLPEMKTAGGRQLTSGTTAMDGSSGMAWMPDGRIIFSSNRSGEYELWTVNADGSDLRQITADSGANRFPRVSPDGRYVVFVSNRSTGSWNLWRMKVDGSELVQLTTGKGEIWPAISADSRTVFYSNLTEVPGRIYQVSIDGGEGSLVPNESFGADGPSVSPDGKMLAYYFYNEPTGWRTGIIPVAGGRTIKSFELQGSRGFEEWTADSRSLIYIKPGPLFSNLWRESIDGREIEQLTHFKDGHIYYFAFSPDRRHVALARGDTFSDIVSIKNFE